jgi:glycine/D-amino acid oxidase-like deaminating enzyme
MEMALSRTVGEIIRVAALEGIDADIRHAGNLSVATTPAQQTRQAKMLEFLRRSAPPDQDPPRILSQAELATRVRVQNGLSAVYNPNAARIQPAKLVRGLASVVEKHGVSIYERTEVTRIDGKRVETRGGTICADVVVRATEGFTSNIEPHQRTVIPLNSAVIVTEPLSDIIWNEIGWDACETISESSYAYSYCQHTRGGRITVGGRGVPYRFGSGVDESGRTQIATIQHLLYDLKRLFPKAAAEARVDQAWCGVLGVSRDWCASVGFDEISGQAWAGGYVGSGLAATNFAGRTLCDLILRRSTELTTFPWVNHRAPKWEPEPFRWMGIHAMYQLYGLADFHERRGIARSSPIGRLAHKISGRPD